MGNAADAKEYRRFKVYMAIGWLLSIVFVVAFSYMVTLITARMIYNATLDVKKTMLRENVESMISYIDVCADKYLKENIEEYKNKV
ncbi:MAG: hypothetical protein IJU50_11350, partial [Lachnospiraceae bacterium]|nr:hypothetical protein [Lachnospiraceae bacterium]